MEFLFITAILIFSIIIHEVSHGYMAYFLGDPTAKYANRLNFNPLNHIDLVGTIIIPGILLLISLVGGGGIIFGWAKPVPINPNNFRDQKYGSLKVALAGPLSNFAVALIFGLSLRFFPLSYSFFVIFKAITFYNILLGTFNLIPIPPLDGSHILFTFASERTKLFLIQYKFLFLIFILFFLFPYISLVIQKIFLLITGVYYFG